MEKKAKEVHHENMLVRLCDKVIRKRKDTNHERDHNKGTSYIDQNRTNEKTRGNE